MRSFMAVFWFLTSVVLGVATNAAETPRTYRVHDLRAHVSNGQVPLPAGALSGIGDFGGAYRSTTELVLHSRIHGWRMR